MVKNLYHPIHDYLHRHEEAYKRVHHVSHLSYFALIVGHGPYHWAALVLLIIGVVSWVVHLDFE